jgi:sterol 3beta-glucosyltransferase
MNIGIFTYGTRGDLQPYVALALGLMEKGHKVTLSATGDFKEFVEGFGVSFHPLWGNAETMMNSNEGQDILQTENAIKLMKYYFKVLHHNREPLRKSYYEAILKVDYIIANSMTLPIVSAIAEKQNKKIALTYFMPPVVPTTEFALGDFDFFNFPWYNKLTYKIAQSFFWKFVKQDTNEYRKELGLKELNENLIAYIDKQKVLDLYCISQSLIPQPKDWETHHKITGFINIPEQKRENHFLDQTPTKLTE